MDLDQFNLIKHFPKMARRMLSAHRHDVAELPHDSDRVRARLSLWLRVLHGDGFLRRLHPLPLE